LKHDGRLPIVGVNTFLAETDASAEHAAVELIRSTEAEKQAQVLGVRQFQQRNAERSAQALTQLQRVATSGGNVFAALMDVVRHASLGQVSRALYAVGGQFRRNV
jgi:methylmalonyl-CoA mutase